MITRIAIAAALSLVACKQSPKPHSGAGSALPAPTQPEAKPPEGKAPDVVDLSGYSKACKTAEDCLLVHAFPCNHCGCPHDAIAKSERDRYDSDAKKIDCAKHPDTRVCGECKDYTATCANNVCGAQQ